MRRAGGIALLAVALWVPRASVQGLPVIDLLNLGQNTVQALQSIAMVANMVLELTPLGEIVLNDTFTSDLSDLGTIVREAPGPVL